MRYRMGGLPKWESPPCVAAAAVGVISKFRLASRPRNYVWSCSYNLGVVVRDTRCIRQWRPELYTECRYKSCEHSGLAWGAFFKKSVFCCNSNTAMLSIPGRSCQVHRSPEGWCVSSPRSTGHQNSQDHRFSKLMVLQYFQIHGLQSLQFEL